MELHSIIVNATILTVDDSNRIVRNGAVAFNNGVITYVGATPEDLDPFDEVIDGRRRIVLPGLINTHGHAGMSLLRGYADDLPLQTWLNEKIWPWEARFTDEHVRWGTGLSLIEMIRTGTTTFVDMYDHNEAVADMAAPSGMRAVLCCGMIGSDNQNVRDRKLADAVSFAKAWHGQADGRITVMLAPHSPYTCTPHFITQILDKAAQLQLPVHTHMSETKWEVELNVQRYGCRPVAHLHKLGMFERQTLVAHAVHLTEEEMDLLADCDVRVSHNAISNLKLASGVAPVPQMLARGISVSLGTDSSASNNNLNLFEELKMAAVLHKGTTYDPLAVPAETALRMATRNGADAVFQPDLIGSIEIGKQADLIMLDAGRANYQPAHNPCSHVVYAANGLDVTDTIVAGKFLMRNGELLTLDEERVMYEANRMVGQLMRGD
ncbi:5-methylthioadenosine/S-adenosylhomocysteine deaminase [Paenibacillus forsythiae]|uniref:5-methylthioadenosine/S-adenosylhomocysteine deaminase n=1 Tax=Paenibacillus forsythiae TaxID=365616 RepID=A0ABU3H9U0_9BACL|nr:amidohydrolase [Paenibacillus forsythiae]MDT3427586.1 5-methylthioadenosine/S-adenosylhomocysteine deaminase [Paenibacillus forsythiae]